MLQTYAYLKRLGYHVIRSATIPPHALVATTHAVWMFPITTQIIKHFISAISSVFHTIRNILNKRFSFSWRLQCTQIRPLLPPAHSHLSYGKMIVSFKALFLSASWHFSNSISFLDIANHTLSIPKACAPVHTIHNRLWCAQAITRLEEEQSWHASVQSISVEVSMKEEAFFLLQNYKWLKLCHCSEQTSHFQHQWVCNTCCMTIELCAKHSHKSIRQTLRVKTQLL